MNENILLVDDEYDILSAFQRNLRKSFKIKTAQSGREGLDLIRESPSFAVVVSDFNMPYMNGVEFLTEVRKLSPDTVRVMLTGNADLQMSINAVNEGNVFRFLTKPINTEILIGVLKDSVEQYRLLTLEKELLDKTFKGTIKILIDLLSAVSPAAFTQAASLRKITRGIAERMGLNNLWEIDMASLLSQIGCVAIPQELLDKKARNVPLDTYEEKLFLSHTRIGSDMIINIPRLENIAGAILYQYRNFDGSDEPTDNVRGNEIPLAARILKAANDYDALLREGHGSAGALELMLSNSSRYDARVFEALCQEHLGEYAGYVVRSIPFRKLRIGMILAEDIRDDRHYTLVTKGHEITDILLMRLINISKLRSIQEPVRILDLSRPDEEE